MRLFFLAVGMTAALTVGTAAMAKSTTSLEQDAPVKELNILINKPQIGTGLKSVTIKSPSEIKVAGIGCKIVWIIRRIGFIKTKLPKLICYAS